MPTARPRASLSPARRSRLMALVALAIALAAFPLGAMASHQFADVPNSNPFHADIDALADSGVTTGCGGGNFCPSAFVTREQMAAFMNRLGALAAGKTPVVNATKLDGLDSSQFARADVPEPGQFNCPGIAMQPEDSGDPYADLNNARHFTGSSGSLVCNLTLPDGATMVSFTAAVYDTSVTDEGICALVRYDRLTLDNTPLLVAITPSSGAPFDGGDALLPTTAISGGGVDNDQYVYVAVCDLYGGGSDIRLTGISVEFIVSGLPVP